MTAGEREFDVVLYYHAGVNRGGWLAYSGRYYASGWLGSAPPDARLTIRATSMAQAKSRAIAEMNRREREGVPQ